MGATDIAEASPPVTVRLDAYDIDKTEVSVAGYARCVVAGKCSTEGLAGGLCNWGGKGRENYPINCVSIETARRFCLSQGKRLPTEAEWEFAARGTDGRRYPWGDAEPDPTRANYGQDFSTGYGTDPVDSHPAGASPFGALNMAGNVWEWVDDTFAPYEAGAVTNPHHTGGASPVMRGGSWSMDTLHLRSAYRRNHPALRFFDLGFRCARSVSVGVEKSVRPKD